MQATEAIRRTCKLTLSVSAVRFAMALVVVLAPTVRLFAASPMIGVNFHHDAAGQLAPGDQAGLLPMSGWQNVDVGAVGNFTGIPFAATSLVHSDGSPSGATLATTVTSGYVGTTPASTSTANGRLMGQYLSWDPVDGTSPEDNGFVTVSNLPASFTSAGYDLIVYSDADVTSGRTFTITITNRDNGTRVTASVADNGTWSGTWMRGTNGNPGNYTRFSGLTATNLTLQVDSTSGRAALNGLQILAGGLPPQLAVSSFAAVPRRITPGGAARLTWNVADATGFSITPGFGDVTALTTNGVGSVGVSPAVTTTYTLTVTNSLTNLTATTTVVVGPPVPNIVVFLVDDMGWQDTSVPFYATNTLLNARYRTPNMERLAARGVKFTSAYACAVCTPTRVSLNTGFNAARHKVTNWTATSANTETSGQTSTLKAPSAWAWNGLQPSTSAYSRVFTNDNTLPALLQAAGYRTIHCGKAHFGSSPTPGSNPLELGFHINIAGSEIGHPASYYGTNNFGSGGNHVPGLEQYHGSNIFLTEALTLEANRALTQAVADRQPFYLYLAHYAVHTPIQLDPRFSTNYPGLDSTERAYATLVEGMDKSLGDILDQLASLGVAQNTIVVFYSDNGGLSAGARGSTPYGGLNTQNFPLRAGKGSAYEGGIREPAIFAWAQPDPTNLFQQTWPIATNSTCARPIIVEDLFPTVLRWAGVTPPSGIDGLDITGYVTAQPGFSRPETFLWHYPHVWSAGYLAQNQGYEPHSVWREGDWKVIYFYDPNRWELYHLATDIREANNLAAAQPQRLMNLARTLARELAARGALFPEQISSGAPAAPVMPNLPAVDTDGDGLSDLSEDSNRNGLLDPGETDPARADTDGDGTPDGAELRLGTDPLNGASHFTLSAIVAGETALLVWPSRAGTLFRVEQSTNVSLPAWSVAADDVSGQDGFTTNSVPAPWPNTNAFFRVLLK